MILKHGYELALEINADIFLIFTESGKSYEIFKEYLKNYKHNLEFESMRNRNNNTIDDGNTNTIKDNANNVDGIYDAKNNNTKNNTRNNIKNINKSNNETSNDDDTDGNNISNNGYHIINNQQKINNQKLKIIVSTPNEDTYFNLKNEKGIIPILMNYRNRYRTTMIKQSIVKLFENNLVKKGDLIVSIVGIPKVSGGTDTISLIEVDDNNPVLKFHQYINSLEKIKALVINEVLNIAMELGVEGREGKPVGTIFIIGDTENVLKMSSQLILNPFEHHKAIIFDKKVKGTIKELSSIDGAFVISEKGEVKSAGRYIECIGGNLSLPLGLGARHYAAAAISKYTDAIAITVSESGGIVRVFKDGEILVEINPNKLDDENSYIC